ncbi:MAG: hypothetical protein WCE21_02865 [Candidatus Babeliales bacterium]
MNKMMGSLLLMSMAGNMHAVPTAITITNKTGNTINALIPNAFGGDRGYLVVPTTEKDGILDGQTVILSCAKIATNTIVNFHALRWTLPTIQLAISDADNKWQTVRSGIPPLDYQLAVTITAKDVVLIKEQKS